jgi:predicted ATP-grasp superfamily ATP-dependent carboligase
MNSVPAIVLGSGITALGAQRVLRKGGVPSYQLMVEDPLLRRSRWFQPLPVPVPPDRRAALADWLPDVGFDRAVLIPCSDHWAEAVAALDSALEDRFPASLTPLAELRLLLDKGKLAGVLDRLAVPHPTSHALRDARDLDGVTDAFLREAFLKPRDSQRFFRRFGAKAFRVRSREDARRRLATAMDAGLEMILQDYVQGPASNHFFVDGFIDRDGRERALFVRQRLRMYPPLFGNSTYMIAVPPERAAPAIESARRVFRELGYRGVFSAEFKLDARDGVFKLLEVNARPWWFVEFAAQCGVDVLRMAYDDALGLPVADAPAYAPGARCVYPYNDYFACQLLRDTDEITWAEMVRSWIGAHQPVFQLGDPWPSLAGGMEVLFAKWGRRLSNGGHTPAAVAPAPADATEDAPVAG